MNDKKAFTLAEVLIALGILGLLALIVIPIMTRSAPDKNRLLFRKAYFKLESVMSQMANDEMDFPTNVMVGGVPSVFNNTTNYTGVTIPANANKFGVLLTTNFLATNIHYGAIGANWVDFDTNDGMSWYVFTDTFPVTTGANAFLNKAVVDVDGRSHGSNCTADTAGGYWKINPLPFATNTTCANPDVFVIGMRYDGKLQPGCSTLATCTTNTDTFAINALSDSTNNTK